MSMRDMDGKGNLALWQSAQAALKARDTKKARAIAKTMKVSSDANLVMEKAQRIDDEDERAAVN